ncbi:MAG: PQQ-like beta-propeller repeat protein, partial [Victivallales bacterium]|nr:PQQ-like beta-propeller repeat protein [Victivallales bacterium]
MKEKSELDSGGGGDESLRFRSSVTSGALACAVVSALFAFAVATVMLADYYRLVTVKPLTLPALTELHQRLSDSPGDAKLKREIRELDLAARTVYFDTVSTFRFGAVLLTVGAVLALVCTHVFLSNRLVPPQSPKKPFSEDPLESAAKSRYYIVSGSLWALAALAVFFFIFGRAVPAVSNKSLSASSKVAIDGHGEAISNVPATTLEFSDDVFESNCPEFRGYRGSAIVAAAERSYPKKWNGATGEGVSWKIKLPSGGFSSPIYWKERLFMTGGDKKRREVFCVDSKSGKILWRSQVPFMAPPGTKVPKVTNDTGYAAPTMATDGTRVFAIFATGDIAALTMDGEFVWKKSLGVPVNHYAFASSLVFIDGKLIVQLYNSDDPRLLALNPATGKVIWTNRSAKEISWSSPISAKIAGNDVLLVQSSVAVLAVAASDGRTLWRTECLAGEVAPCPAIIAGRVFAANDNASALALDAAT